MMTAKQNVESVDTGKCYYFIMQNGNYVLYDHINKRRYVTYGKMHNLNKEFI